jgi:hypothetical protein
MTVATLLAQSSNSNFKTGLGAWHPCRQVTRIVETHQHASLSRNPKDTDRIGGGIKLSEVIVIKPQHRT